MLRRAAQLLVVAAAVVAGCAPDGPDGPTSPSAESSPSTAVPTLDTVAAVAAAIDVRADGCGPRIGFGTGTVVGGGDIVTAAHVVAGSTSIEVIDVEGNRSDAAVVVFDPELDFAVLRPARAVGTPITMRDTEARRGEAGVSVRIREIDGEIEIEQLDVVVVREANISTTDIYRDTDVVRDGFEIDSAIDVGDSGAMVVLPGGGVGIVWARSNRLDGRAWAIDLPPDVVDGSALRGALAAVDVGECSG